MSRYFVYWRKHRELEDKHVGKVKLYGMDQSASGIGPRTSASAVPRPRKSVENFGDSSLPARLALHSRC